MRVGPRKLLARRSFERNKKGRQHAITRRTADANNEPCNYKRCLYFSTMRFASHAAATHITRHQQTTRMRVKKHTRTPLQKHGWIDHVLWQPISTDSLNPAWRVPHDSWRHAMKFGTEGGVHRHGTPIPQHKHPLFSHVCAFVRTSDHRSAKCRQEL